MTSRDPRGRWATAAQSPKGKVGVAVGNGDTQLFFLEESIVATFCAKALEVGPTDEETKTLVPLIKKAAEGLVQFKRALKAANRTTN